MYHLCPFNMVTFDGEVDYCRKSNAAKSPGNRVSQTGIRVSPVNRVSLPPRHVSPLCHK